MDPYLNMVMRRVCLGILLIAATVGCVPDAITRASYATLQEQDEQLLHLLETQDYIHLDAYLEGVVTRYKEDVRAESTAIGAFDTFRRARPELEPLLTGWIAARPNSSSAYLARGAYYSSRGWGKRGKRLTSQTTDVQFAEMMAFFQKSHVDLDKAIALDPDFPLAFCYKMEMMMASGTPPDEIRKLRDTALEFNPYSVSVRSYFITTRIPKWGGSMEEISKEIADARRYYDKNPDLKVLEGRLAAAMGDRAVKSGNYPLGVEFYTKALTHGPSPSYLMSRGNIYIRLGQSGLGEQDLLRAIQLRPNYPAALYSLGFNYYQRAFSIGDVYEARASFSLAAVYLTRCLDAEPENHKALDIRGNSRFNLRQDDLALRDFERALDLVPWNDEYQENVEKVKATIAKSSAN